MTTTPPLKPARSLADLNRGLIVATVEIAAPRERVFKAISDGHEITKWWGSPRTYQTTEHTADLRKGGKWRSAGKGADGAPFFVGGEFLEVDPPRTLAMTWAPQWDPGHTTTVRYHLEEISGGTRLTLLHEGFAGRPDTCNDHGSGWEFVLGLLRDYLAPEPAAAYFLCRLLPPRPDFMMTMSAEEKGVMHQHLAYMRGLKERGVVLLFGPVADPKGGWGVGIVKARDAAQVAAITSQDPAVLSGKGLRYEVLPMPNAIY